MEEWREASRREGKEGEREGGMQVGGRVWSGGEHGVRECWWVGGR